MLPEQISRIDSRLIYPPLWALVPALLDACERRGVRYYAISGYRGIPEQNGLYAQGRTVPGDIVTNAKGGYSYHNQGLALDFCRDINMARAGLQPSWNRADYQILAEEAQKFKQLEAGFFWKFQDNPHIQWRLPKGILLFPQRGVAGTDLLTINPDGARLQDVFHFLATHPTISP